MPNKILDGINKSPKEVKKKSKHPLESKMFWVNLLVGIADLLEVLPIPHATAGLAVANLGLRLITNQPLSFFRKED